MAFDPFGRTGLRRRLQQACSEPSSFEQVAFILNVDAGVLQEYVEHISYVLSDEDLLRILENLSDVPIRAFSVTGQQGFNYIIHEKPEWTLDDIDNIVPPEGAVSVAITFFNANYPDAVETDGPVDLDTFTVQQVIDDAIGVNTELLIAVRFYVPYIQYDWYPR